MMRGQVYSRLLQPFVSFASMMVLQGLTAVKALQLDATKRMQVHEVSALCSLVCPLVAVQRAKRLGFCLELGALFEWQECSNLPTQHHLAIIGSR